MSIKSRWTIAVGLFVVYLLASLSFSRSKPLWGDETFGLERSVAPPVTQLLWRGAPEQGSPSPLYYLMMKAYRPVTVRLKRAGVVEPVLWRIPTVVCMVAGAVLFLYRHRSRDEYLWAIFLVTLLLFAKEAFYYASEARPYGLWLILSFLYLDHFRKPYSGAGWVVLCIGLGLTATASMFILLASLAALGFAAVFRKGSIEKSTIIGILIGIGASAYYARLAGHWSYPPTPWAEFWNFYCSYKWAMLTSLILFIGDWRESDAPSLALSGTVLLWFVMAPAINWITQSHGFFFSERQYIYWSAGLVMLVAQSGRRCPKRASDAAGWMHLILLLLCAKRLNVPATLRVMTRLIQGGLAS